MKGEKEEEAKSMSKSIEWNKISSVFFHDLMPSQYKLQIICNRKYFVISPKAHSHLAFLA
jgi:hypothetical protein